MSNLISPYSLGLLLKKFWLVLVWRSYQNLYPMEYHYIKSSFSALTKSSFAVWLIYQPMHWSSDLKKDASYYPMCWCHRNFNHNFIGRIPYQWNYPEKSPHWTYFTVLDMGLKGSSHRWEFRQFRPPCPFFDLKSMIH